MAEEEVRFSQEQYDMLKRCSDKKDMTEWNEWRKKNPDEKILLEKADLERAYLEDANLQEAYLVGANLQKANLWKAVLIRGDLQRSNLQEAHLWGANLQETMLSGADLQKANLQKSNLREAMVYKANLQEAKLEQADLQQVNFLGANLQEANLRKANLREAKFEHANLQEAKLEQANLQQAVLEKVNLQKAVLVKANLQGTNFDRTRLQESVFKTAIVDGETLIWNCQINKETDFTGVGLDSIRIDPESKQLLEYNIRRNRWEKWYKWEDWFNEEPKSERSRIKQFMYGSLRLFWSLSDYGRSTGRIITWFFVFSILFAAIYANFPYMIKDLAIAPQGNLLHRCFLVTIRPIYFSVVTMTTLGFGDMHADSQSIWGHILLMIQVLLGYVMLGALVTRFAVLFTAGGPAGEFTEMEEGSKV
jgi:uncharacterized protein YjbI with pentapeptide repeats